MCLAPRLVSTLLVLVLGTTNAVADPSARIAASKSLDRAGYLPAPRSLPPIAESEPNDSPGAANPIGIDAPLDAELTPATDQDWFILNAVAGSYLSVSTSATGSELTDTVLEAFASDGGTRTAIDDDSGLGLYSALQHLEVPADGVLYLRVTRFSDQGDDAYRLLVEAGSAPPPVPANDTVPGAAILGACNTALTGSTTGATNRVDEVECLGVDPLGGEVFYRVLVPFSFELSVLVEPEGPWDLSTYMFTDPQDPWGSCVDAADVAYAGEAETVRFLNELLPAREREVWIAVDSWSAEATGEFILSTRCDFVVANEGSSFSALKARFQED